METATQRNEDEPPARIGRIYGEARAMGQLGMRVDGDGGTARPLARRDVGYRRALSGFTLVELLAVILIVGMLAAILTPVVMQSLTKARNTAIKAEIDMLHMAIMNYKNQHGSFPPAFDETPIPEFGSPTTTGIVNRHLQRLFPRISRPPNPDYRANPAHSNAIFDPNTDGAGATNPNRLTHALGWWLRGYTENPTDPLGIGVTAGPRTKLFDFDASRLTTTTVTVGVFSEERYSYHPTKKPGSPYVYIPATQYIFMPYPANGSSRYGAHRRVVLPDPNPFANPAHEFFNPDTFQILCAGQDEQFGTDDDLSNFWSGTRREYLDTLKN